MRNSCLILSLLFLSACATVRQADLDAWKNQPVDKLDTHSIFVQIPMKKVVTSDGTEHRFYINSGSSNQCFANTTYNEGLGIYQAPSAKTVNNCVTRTATCNNVFKIKDGRVLSYEPKGSCYTNASARPEY